MIKEPTAELRPDQKDRDTLPPYKYLDPILKNYIEEDKGVDAMVNVAMTKKEIERVLGMVDNSEYKRRQSPPGIKITPKAFGKDRRMPITNKVIEGANDLVSYLFWSIISLTFCHRASKEKGYAQNYC